MLLKPPLLLALGRLGGYTDRLGFLVCSAALRDEAWELLFAAFIFFLGLVDGLR